MYNELVTELVMGRVGYGPSLYGPSSLWAEFVMGRVRYGPRCPVTTFSIQIVVVGHKFVLYRNTSIYWLDHLPPPHKIL